MKAVLTLFLLLCILAGFGQTPEYRYKTERKSAHRQLSQATGNTNYRTKNARTTRRKHAYRSAEPVKRSVREKHFRDTKKTTGTRTTTQKRVDKSVDGNRRLPRKTLVRTTRTKHAHNAAKAATRKTRRAPQKISRFD
jgi:hypothetical protein